MKDNAVLQKKNIALSLSGGGIRAAVFHAGVLRYLAEKEILDRVSFISTVSGASLLVGLIYSFSNNSFPSSKEYIDSIRPKIKHLITTTDLQEKCIYSLLHPKNWMHFLNRGNILANELKRYWGIKGGLQDISDNPKWVINGTTRETGKCWRFSKERMGDYLSGYVTNPVISIAEAIAASASYPPAIDHYRLQTSKYKWKTYDKEITFKSGSQPTIEAIPEVDCYHITDGGVYDNLATEAVFNNLGISLRENIDNLIVSDAGSNLDIREVGQFFISKIKRNFEIVLDQIISLRTRTIVNFFLEKPNIGAFLKIGKNATQLFFEAKKLKLNVDLEESNYDFLGSNDVKKSAQYPTNLKKMSFTDFELIERHGYETAMIQISIYMK